MQGLTKDELQRVTDSIQYALPSSYIRFLNDYGKECGTFGADSHLLFPFMIGLNRELQEMLSEESLDVSIPKKAFVFSGYQGFQYHFFVCETNEDPAVYRVMNGGEQPIKISESFSEYIKEAANVSL